MEARCDRHSSCLTNIPGAADNSDLNCCPSYNGNFLNCCPLICEFNGLHCVSKHRNDVSAFVQCAERISGETEDLLMKCEARNETI